MYEQLDHKIYYHGWGDTALRSRYLMNLNGQNLSPRGLFYLSHSGGANWMLNILEGDNTREIMKNGDPGSITFTDNMFIIKPKYTYMSMFYVGSVPIKVALTTS